MLPTLPITSETPRSVKTHTKPEPGTAPPPYTAIGYHHANGDTNIARATRRAAHTT